MSPNPTTRILIIDDDDAVLTAQQRLLACAGYDVRVAGGPYEGLDVPRPTHHDLSSGMIAMNFTARGSRWRVLPILSEEFASAHLPPLSGTGLFFTSDEGEARFLVLAPNNVPSPESLRRKPVGELANLVHLATPLAS